MPHFHYKNNELFIENTSAKQIAEAFGTPCYVYSRTALEQHWREFSLAFKSHSHLICYAVKANHNLAVLNVLARLGSGFDIVSLGELERVIAAGGSPQKIVFSGVGKQVAEITRALELGIYCFNVESRAELFRIQQIAQALNTIAPIALRINPDVDPKTHPYIATGLKDNKFGIDIAQAIPIYLEAKNLTHIEIKGLAYHIGSQLTELEPFVAALERVLPIIDELKNHGIVLQHLDVGGGLGVRYHDETPPTVNDYVTALLKKLAGCRLPILLEPGRAIAADTGILLTRIEYLKSTANKHFAIVDAAMNDLMRPALYNAWHNIIPVTQQSNQPDQYYDIVGPVCETGDWLGKERLLNISAGDLLAICSVGAYGFILSSNYNSRPRPPEVMVQNDQAFLVRPREVLTELFAGEKRLL